MTWVAVSDDGKIATSDDDGATWTPVADSSFGTTRINSIHYDAAGFLFIAVGDEGKVATSSDLVNWTQRISGF